MMQPFDPVDFFNLASELANQDDEEAKLRTAIGRAYYAAFLVAREKANIRGRHEVHKKAIEAVKQRPGYRSTGDQLAALRRLRSTVDYDLLPENLDDRNWAANWSTAKSLAERILLRLSAL